MTTETRDPRYAAPGTNDDIELASALRVGDRVRFDGEKQARWKVRARGDRYIVLTRPVNLRNVRAKNQYTVIDLELGIRGTDDCVGGLGYETPDAITRAIGLLEAGDFEISVRNNVQLAIVAVKAG